MHELHHYRIGYAEPAGEFNTRTKEEWKAFYAHEAESTFQLLPMAAFEPIIEWCDANCITTSVIDLVWIEHFQTFVGIVFAKSLCAEMTNDQRILFKLTFGKDAEDINSRELI